MPIDSSLPFSANPSGARLISPLIVVVWLFVASNALSGCSSPALPANSHTAPDPRFGAVETYHAPEAADHAQVGWTRLIFYWSELQRTGPDDWNPFHEPLERIDREIAGGREVVGMLQHTPQWATDGLADVGVPRGLYLPVDDPDNLWAGFVRKVVGEYKGRVDRWIIWNEPDIPLDVYGAQWQGTVEDYYQLVKVAYQAAHEANPDVQIHLSGLTYWHDKVYLEKFLTVAEDDPTAPSNDYYFDVVSVHIYFKPETTSIIVGSIRKALAEAGIEKPIWINETNAPPYDDPANLWEQPDIPITQEAQVSFLMQEYALALAEDVDRISVYKWIDQPPVQPGFEPFGLLRDNGDPRPVLTAFQTITTYYRNAESARHVEQEKFHEVILDQGERSTRVLWSRLNDSVFVLLPALASTGTLVEKDGAARGIQPVLGYYLLELRSAYCPAGQGCLIGGPPLLIVENTRGDLTDVGAFAPVLAVTRTTLTRVLIAGGGFVLVGAAALIYYRRRRKRGS